MFTLPSASQANRRELTQVSSSGTSLNNSCKLPLRFSLLAASLRARQIRRGDEGGGPWDSLQVRGVAGAAARWLSMNKSPRSAREVACVGLHHAALHQALINDPSEGFYVRTPQVFLQCSRFMNRSGFGQKFVSNEGMRFATGPSCFK